MRIDDERHGTYAGLQAHKRDGETPCADCRGAGAEYIRDWRTKPGTWRQRQQARERALVLLRQAHPEEYTALYVGEVNAILGNPRHHAEVVRP